MINRPPVRRLYSPAFRLLAIGVLLAAFALRLWHIETQSIWHDEGWSIHAVRDPINTPDDKTPLAYYSLMHVLWQAGVGESPLGLRYGSALLGLVGVAAALALGKRRYGATVGLTAGALTAFSPLLWAYSQEVRAYIAIPLLAVVLLAGAEKLLRHDMPRKRDWLLVFAAELIALYTHNLGVPLVLWVNAALGLAWLVMGAWRRIGVWAIIQAALGLLYVPWLLTQAPSGTPLNTPPQIGLALLRDIWYSAFLPVLLQLRQIGENAPLDLLCLLLLLGSAALLIYAIRHGRREKLRAWLLLSHITLVPVFTLVVLLAAHVDFHPRYFITAVPAMLLTLAAGTAIIAGSFFKHRARVRVQMAACSLLVVYSAFISLGSLNAIESNRAYQHDDFAGLAAYYASLPENTVILMPFGTEPALQGYFAPRLNIRTRFVNVPLYSSEAAALEAINQMVRDGARQVEFLTWYQLPADERGMYPCLLAAASSGMGESHTFYGLMTRSYSLDHLLTLSALDASPRFDPLALQNLAYAAAPSGVCVRSQWQRSTLVAEDLHVVATLLNPLDQTVARSDAPITRDDQASMPLWTDSDSGAAYNLLTLPPGAPALDYSLALTLYSASQPSGYDVHDAAGVMLGKQLRLQAAIRAAGPAYTDVVTKPMLQSDSTGESKTITTGIPLDLTLLLPAGEKPGLIRLAGEGWSLEMPAQYAPQPSLSWQRVMVPPGDSGEAVLSVEGHELARYTVIDPPRAFNAPSVDIPLNVNFPGVGTLVGATLNPPDFAGSGLLEVTLIWQAEATPSVSYTVFVQLLGSDGSVIAQNDALPAVNARPTTGWVTGEYIADIHTLDVPPYSGQARLIVGLYDAASPGLPRVLTADGADYVEVK